MNLTDEMITNEWSLPHIIASNQLLFCYFNFLLRVISDHAFGEEKKAKAFSNNAIKLSLLSQGSHYVQAYQRWNKSLFCWTVATDMNRWQHITVWTSIAIAIIVKIDLFCEHTWNLLDKLYITIFARRTFRRSARMICCLTKSNTLEITQSR